MLRDRVWVRIRVRLIGKLGGSFSVRAGSGVMDSVSCRGAVRVRVRVVKKSGRVAEN